MIICVIIVGMSMVISSYLLSKSMIEAAKIKDHNLRGIAYELCRFTNHLIKPSETESNNQKADAEEKSNEGD